MNHNNIEGLSETQILNLYDDTIETNQVFSKIPDYAYCHLYCTCSDGNTVEAYGYEVNLRINEYLRGNWGRCTNGNTKWNLTGGCPSGTSNTSMYFDYCTIYR